MGRYVGWTEALKSVSEAQHLRVFTGLVICVKNSVRLWRVF